MKEERSKQGQTNKAKQHSTPKAVTLPKKNELPQVGLEPTTLHMYAMSKIRGEWKGNGFTYNMYIQHQSETTERGSRQTQSNTSLEVFYSVECREESTASLPQHP